MNEQQYINATNHTKITMALSILGDVLVCGESGINKKEFSLIKSNLYDIKDKLFNIVEVV